MMILKQKRDLGLGRTEVLCYAFAPPPVFGPADKLPREAQRVIRSFVFGNDMVCRLPLSNAYDLFRELEEVDAIEVGSLNNVSPGPSHFHFGMFYVCFFLQVEGRGGVEFWGPFCFEISGQPLLWPHAC